MSRWMENYQAHQFHLTWDTFKNNINNFSTEDIVDSDTLLEIARLKKVIQFINSYLKLIDPEINRIDALNAPLQSLKNALAEFNAFILHRDINHIKNSNYQLDDCAVHLKNLNILLPKVSKNSITLMLKKYNDTISEALNTIDLPTMVESSDKIKQIEINSDAINEKLEGLLEKSNINYEEIHGFHKDILEDDGDYKSIKTMVNEAKENILTEISELEIKIKESSEKIEKLTLFDKKIFGYEKEDGEKVIGLKDEIEERKNELNDLKAKHGQKYKAIVDEINSLLPGATSAGLATAYTDERKKFIEPIKYWNIAFFCSLILIAVLSFLGLNGKNTIYEITEVILHSLPMTAPLAWLALYASKRRSENQRLEQEYAHKESLAKSYIGFKKQIEDLNDDNQTLLAKLIDNAIKTIAENPSKSLDKKHGDGTILTEIAKQVKNIASKE